VSLSYLAEKIKKISAIEVRSQNSGAGRENLGKLWLRSGPAMAFGLIWVFAREIWLYLGLKWLYLALFRFGFFTKPNKDGQSLALISQKNIFEEIPKGTRDWPQGHRGTKV
jgi:hypothetical protein